MIPAQAVNLPIAAALDDLNAALLTGHALLQAPTGSGKSTQVPLALLDRNWLAGRRILMLEPRRPAARLTAAHMADLLGEKLGETVGYQVRFERRIGPRTRIEVLTEGILTRRLQSDPALEGVGLVIFDELHELNLPSALGLALTLDVIANLRPDLRILAMSATLNSGPLAALLGGAPLIQAGGRPYPVEIHYAERDPGRDWLPALVATIRQALADQSGNLLAFLPGAGEIERVRERLAGLTEAGIQILPLHGALPVAAQDLALGPGDGRRRLVLATDLAETSVTIPGIGVVVDSGLTRKPRFEPGSGLTRLVTEPIPRASAEQRAGRAGRLGPGVCYRHWTRAQEAGRPEHRTPEILQADLAPLALELAFWGVRDPAELQWLQAPPRPAWEQGLALLVRLGALDAAGHITQLGRAMAGLPVHPRLAALLTGAPPELAGEAADLCALLSERDPWLRRPGEPGSADLGPAWSGCKPSGTTGAPATWRAAGWPLSTAPLPNCAGWSRARSHGSRMAFPASAACSPWPIRTGSPSGAAGAMAATSWPRAPAPPCRRVIPWPATPTWWPPAWTPPGATAASSSPCPSPKRRSRPCSRIGSSASGS